MTNTNCLNCEKELIDKFCYGCGQKSDTSRISFKNFIFHDLLHGIFHIEKGIYFTAKQALTRPGKASLDYIAGKRKRFYNIFYLILITFGFLLFIRHFHKELFRLQEDEVVTKTNYINNASKSFDEILIQKSKLIIFLFIPLSAVNSYLIFKRKKFNVFEHSILAAMILLGMLLISVFGNLFFYIDLIMPFGDVFSTVASWIVTFFIFVHIYFGYYNAFSLDYSKAGISLRIILFYVLLCIEIGLLFLLLWGFLSDWKFGRIHISLF